MTNYQAPGNLGAWTKFHFFIIPVPQGKNRSQSPAYYNYKRTFYISKSNENSTMFIFTFQTREEMEEQEITIRDLELALQAKINPLKLAETRLENRKMRPHMDLCADVPMEGLIAEVQAIRNTMQMLRDKLDHARYCYSVIIREVPDYRNS